MMDALPHQWMTEQRRFGHEICLVLDSANERETRRLLLNSSQFEQYLGCLLYTSPSPRDATLSRMPSSA